ncbi:hypothetical protein AB6A40_002524 [Gnathostoma spinigerum]|uniref:BRO1 domain-containing protein n=1 Tax=Gnathostoma spinigerum TaxID=75299 RepID=A0ABD6E6U0_9BILA
MTTFLAAPLKSTTDVDLAKPFKAYIESVFSSCDNTGSEITEAVNELNKLRNKACVQPLDKQQTSLDILTR